MSTADLKTAIRLHRGGRLQAAHEIYAKLLAASPTDARLRSLAGQLEMQMGQPDSAIAHLREAAALAPDDQRIALTLARALAHADRPDEALGIVRGLLDADATLAPGWATLAAIQRRRSDHRAELAALEQAARLAPHDVAILIAKANAEAANDAIDRATATLRRAAELAPDNARIANNLGALYVRVHRLDAAVDALRRALELAPNYAMAAANLGMALHRLGRLEEAREIAETAVRLAPDNPDTRAELAAILMAQGDLAGAESGYRTALEKNPRHQRLLAGLAELRDRQGRPDEGLRLIDELVAAGPVGADVRLVGAALARRVGQREKALGLVAPLRDDSAAPSADLDPGAQRRLSFLLGEIHDAGGDYERALRHYDAANALLRPPFDLSRVARRVDAIVAAFDAGTARRDGDERGRPRRLFMVGMPRSGTSLLETMLSRHPRVQACGELPLIARLVDPRGDFPQDFLALAERDVQRLADRYRSAVAAPAEKRCLTDKMPLNFFYLGAIVRMLPEARIVHCRRGPADTLLSCYFQNFLDPALAFCFDLDRLSAYWREYSRLMNHWRATLGNAMFEFQYEELVNDPETQLQALLAWAGLDWDPAVLSPQDADRYVSTASHAQVREPLHDRSVGRFGRYRPFLGERARVLENLR